MPNTVERVNTDDLEVWVVSKGVETIDSSVLGSSVLCKAVE